MKTLAAILLALPFAAGAEPPAQAEQNQTGAESRAWVDLQKSGKQASGAARPMPGEIADHVYQRYADSFKQPIPAKFKRQSAGASGDSAEK